MSLIERVLMLFRKPNTKPEWTSYRPPFSSGLVESSLSGDTNIPTNYGNGLQWQSTSLPPIATSYSINWAKWTPIQANLTSCIPYVGLLSQQSLSDLETFDILHDSAQFTSYLKQLAEKAT